MKIMHLIDVPWDSGLAHYALVLAQGQKKKGHQVFVSALPGEKPWHKAHRLGLKTLPMIKLRNLTALRRFVSDHGIQVLNAHTGSTHSLAVAAALGQPVAVVRTRSDARAIRKRPGRQLLYHRTQRVISAAGYIRDSLIRDLEIQPKKVLTVYQGVELSRAMPKEFPKEPKLGIVARLDPVKGHRYLIEALSLLRGTYPGLRLLVAGQEENIKLRDLQKIAQRLRVDPQVEFLGFQREVDACMSDCTIGVIPSTGSEAVSRVALEWMAAGRPVVATRVGCLPEIVQEGVTGYLVDPEDAPALASAIARLLHEPAKARSMGDSAWSRVKRHFSMEHFVERTLRIYQEALSSL